MKRTMTFSLFALGAGALALTFTNVSFAQRNASAQPAIPNLAGKILTVRGPIDPSALGQTLMHEHIFIQFKAPLTAEDKPQVPGHEIPLRRGSVPSVFGKRPPGWNLLNNYDEMYPEVMLFKKAGGGTIVNVTNIGLTRHPDWLLRMSKETGLNIVMGSGYYQKAFHPLDMDKRTVEDLTKIIVHDITVGAEGTNIRSGIIGEIGIEGRPITPNEVKSIRASARASLITGAPMTFHMGGGTPAEKQRTMDIVKEEGVDLRHVVMGHNGNGDIAAMRAITDRGPYIEFDFFGFGPEGVSEKAIDRLASNMVTLINAGLTDHILVGHDICTQPQLTVNGGGGFAFFSTKVVPALKAKGVSDEVIHKILVDNPRRALTFVAPHPIA